MQATFRAVHSRPRARNARIAAAFGAAIALALVAAPAQALIVKTWNGSGTPQFVNQSAPVDDPGWANTPSNRSAIYLGNQWVLTAKHAGTGDITLPSGSYRMVPNSAVTLTNPSMFRGRTLTPDADLVLYRIDTNSISGLTPEQADPNIKNIVLASSTPSQGTQVTLIGSGATRAIDPNDANGQFHWNVSGNRLVTGPSVGATEHGFFSSGPNGKTWGTNRIAAPTSVPGAITQGNNLLITFSGGNPNDVIGTAIQFDRGLDNNNNPVSDGSLADEAQGAGGDSGSPVFFKDAGNQWVLGGLVHAIYLKSYQNPVEVLFGTQTALSDLSQSTYRSQIEALRLSHQYSVLGDIDLDGSATGGVVNGAPTGDLSVLIANWGYHQAVADIVSWKRGDLNQDGQVGLADFALMRQALGGTISQSALATLLASVAVPEPSSAMLAGALLVTGRRRRRSM